MQSIVSINGKSVLVGLNWSVLGNTSVRKKEIANICKETGLHYGVVVAGSSSDVGAIGLSPKKVDYPSAAAWFAMANQAEGKSKKFGESGPAWIIVEKVQTDDRRDVYWLCAVTDGVPVPGTDVVEEISVINAKLPELIEILEDVEIFSPDPDVQEYVATGNFIAHNKSLTEIAGSVGESRQIKVQKLDGLPPYVMPGLFLVGGLILAGTGFSWYQDYQAKELKAKQAQERKKKAEQERLQLAEKNTAEYRSKVEAARTAAVQKVVSDLSHTPSEVVTSWYSTIERLSLNNGGWDLVSAVCDLNQCEVVLERNKLFGSNTSLLEKIPDAQIEPNGDRARFALPITLSSGAKRNVNLQQLRNFKDFQVSGVSTFQELKALGTDANLSPVKDVTFQPPPLPPAQPGGPPTSVRAEPIGVAKGNVGIGRQGLFALAGLPEVLMSPEIALERLEVQFPRALSGEASWRVSGVYYVNSPVVPAPAATPAAPAPNAPK